MQTKYVLLSKVYVMIDVLNSVSRVMLEIAENGHYQTAQKLRSTMATYREAEDLINIGAYVTGSNPDIDRAIHVISDIKNFLKQDVYENNTMEETVRKLNELMS
ncbi:hypothetical protein HA075_21910 [bacterium BFN5]|nr:hypothetical protein HA075_21910 [bacterium BFN5]